MIDREKVISGLQRCRLINKVNCDKCPYDYNGRGNGKSECTAELATDVLELLKKREAVEPKTEPSAKGYWYTCGACGWWLFEARDTVHFDDRKRVRFCSSCGRAVKWE